MVFVSKTLIEKGWSGDRKYLAVTETGEKYLYRVSDENSFERKKSEFEMMNRLSQLEIPMCLPVEFGKNEDGVYSVQTWIEGEDAEEMMPQFSEDKQYAYGFESGKILKRIHSIPAPDTQQD